MYSNKESGFKAQGILINPIILSIGTQIKKDSKNYQIESYCLNQSFLFCKDLMGIAAFERLESTISLGDADIESMAPLFEAFNDHEEFVPRGGVEELLKALESILNEIKRNCSEENEEAEETKIKEIMDRFRGEHNLSIEELAYLMEYGSLQRRVASKISTLAD